MFLCLFNINYLTMDGQMSERSILFNWLNKLRRYIVCLSITIDWIFSSKESIVNLSYKKIQNLVLYTWSKHNVFLFHDFSHINDVVFFTVDINMNFGGF